MLATGAMSSWTYVVTLGLYIFNGWTPGDELGEFTWLANGGVALSIILLAHVQFGKLLHTLRW
jgi:hypothetical protein